jgi:myxalamid-type polyketide synthase MxaE and MxaD
MTTDVENLASLSIALAKSGVSTLGALLVVSPEAPVMGFVRSLSLEHPGWACRGIQAGTRDLDASTLYREASAKADDLVVSYRGGRRFVPVLTSIQPYAERPPLRQGGVYWVTGGMGSLGRVIAEEMARVAGARLLLTGRRPTCDGQVLERIRAAGGDAMYLACDATDGMAMERAHALVLERWGGLHGVVHAAGSVDDVLISNRDRNKSREAISAKLQGARVLAETTKTDDLDFIVFFSSLVALTGMPGQTDYAAA